MRYVPNTVNLARTATIAATNIVPSAAIEQTSVDAEGGGTVELAGPYTGQADTEIEVEYVDTTLTGAPRVSAPTFTGVGNGQMTDIDPGTLDPQVFTVTAVDLGTETRFAVGRFCGVRLVARTAGDGGNAIQITVDDTGLVSVPADYSATREIPAGAVDLEGEAFDFGGPSLTADGQVPANAPRLRFGRDPVVYRAWRRWSGERWLYNLSPAPIRAIPAGTPVQLVSGSYTVAVSDGDATRTYAGVTSVYDALAAMLADPDGLVSPVDPPVVDRSPGGMATLDIWERTAPFVVSQLALGSEFVRRAELGYEPSLAAPTETLTITCIDDTRPGAERWRVEGTQSGTLAAAITGVLYDAAPGSFRIPSQLAGPPSVSARISYTVAPQPRTPPAPDPCIHLARLQLGARARSRTITWTLRQRPSPACDCREQPIEGGPSFECLGLEPEGGGSMNIHPVLQRRVERIAAWRSGLAERRGGAVDGDALMGPVNQVAAFLGQQLRRLDAGTPLAPAWAASTSTPPNTVRRPTTPNGFRYRYDGLAAANTGATEPTWPTTIGATVTDGGVTWVNAGRDVGAELDLLLTRVEGEWSQFDRASRGASAGVWRASATGLGSFVAPTAANGRLFAQVNAVGPFTTGASEPTWPTTDYATVVDGNITWMALPRYWTASQLVTKDTVRVIGLGLVARAIVGGTTGVTEPSWAPRTASAAVAIGREVVDGGVTWRIEAATDDVGLPNLTQYLQALTGLLGPAYTAAGLDPFGDASAQGSRCWRDVPSATEWWVPDDPTLMPAFTGHYYHAVRRVWTATGEEQLEDTQEFGFGVQACDTVVGDSFVLRIEAGPGQQGGQTYVLGDRITLDVIRAVPLPMGGGQTGNDELTFSVVGSVAGGLPDYVIDRTAPAAYSGGGLEFAISLGSVPFALGDRFRFEVEGGRWRWRRDGGTWSSPAAIGAGLALADGLSVSFRGGGAPSFVAGDRWTWRALAINGPGQLRRPTPGRLATSAATTITLGSVAGAVRTAIIADHAIPSTATITLQASALADFSVLSYSSVIPWRRGDIVHELPAAVTAAHWRLIVSAACEIGWLAMGEPMTLSTARGNKALGDAVRRLSLPALSPRVRTSIDVSHEMLSHDSVEALFGALEAACADDDRLIGVLIGDQHHIVRVAEEPITVTDLRQHQPRDPDAGLYALSLSLEAA